MAEAMNLELGTRFTVTHKADTQIQYIYPWLVELMRQIPISLDSS